MRRGPRRPRHRQGGFWAALLEAPAAAALDARSAATWATLGPARAADEAAGYVLLAGALDGAPGQGR